MDLTKVLTINFEKKDCDPVECPYCNQNNWRISKVTQRATELQHLHFTCVFCDLSFCPGIGEAVKRVESQVQDVKIP